MTVVWDRDARRMTGDTRRAIAFATGPLTLWMTSSPRKLLW